MDKPIITHNKYLKLKSLIHSPQDENLVISILENCDINKSIVFILCLMTQKRNDVYRHGSILGKSKILMQHLEEIIEFKSSFVDLNDILNIYDEVCRKLKTPQDPKTIRFIVSEYKPRKLEFPVNQFKSKLNPKKNIKK